MSRGPASLTDAELLAVLLGTGSRGRDVLTLARELLIAFGGLRGLLASDPETLMRAQGIGIARVALLRALLEVSERFLTSRLREKSVLTDPGATRAFLRRKLGPREREVFACLYLDNQHRVIDYEELFLGTIDAATVHPREVVKQLLAHNAAAVIFAHNHPSGVAEPSAADQRITERLVSACALVDVRVLDHMVVGDAEIVSFAERGLLAP